MGASGHVLHVVGSVTLTDLRDAQILRGFVKLSDRQTDRHSELELTSGQTLRPDRRGLNLVARLRTLDGNLLNLLADAQLAVGKVRPMAETQNFLP